MAGRRLTAITEDTVSDFEERTIEVRGQTYKIRELASGEYDKLYKMAENGSDLDTTMLLRLMAHKSVIEPEKFTADDLAAMPMRAARQLLSAVNELHFGDEVATEESPKND